MKTTLNPNLGKPNPALLTALASPNTIPLTTLATHMTNNKLATFCSPFN